MEWNKRKKLMIRWSIITTGAIALFWGIWYLVAGSVPELAEIKWDKETTYQLPFAISRWWDVMFAPIWTAIIVWAAMVLKSKTTKIHNLSGDLTLGLVVGLGGGLLMGLGLGPTPADLKYSLLMGLGVCLCLGWGVCLGDGWGAGLISGLSFGLGVCLGIGLKYSLSVGLSISLGVGLSISLGVCLGIGLISIIKIIIRQNIWHKLYTWLILKE